MPSDDEFRRVAEDVRALASSLAREVRETVDQVRADSWAARRSARDDARQMRADLRDLNREYRWGGWNRPGCPGGRPPWSQRQWSAPAADPRTTAGQAAFAAGGAGGAAAPPAPWAPPPPAPPAPDPLPPVRHRRDSSTLLGVLAVVFGLAWLIAGTHLFRVSAEGVLAVALMVLGAATVLTARTDWALSRRPWPVWLGAGLLLLLLVTVVSPRFPGSIHATAVRAVPGGGPFGIGSKTATYTSWDQVPPALDGGIGRTTVDLRGLPGPPAQDTSLQVDGRVGEMVVELPPNLHVHLNAHVGLGRIFVNDQAVAKGFSSDVQQDLGAGTPGPVLNLTVNTTGGVVRILDQGPPAQPPGKP